MIQTAFDALLSNNINLSASQIAQGSTSQVYIRELLLNKSREENDLPWIIDGDFLSGSYARGTKIYPLNDIDVMVVLDGTGLFPIQNGVQVNASIRGGGRNGSPVHVHNNQYGYISSVKILEAFKKQLCDSYPNSEIKKDGQAVNVWLDSYKMGLDIVPCFHIIPYDNKRDYYFIPQGRGSDMWMTTNPQIDKEISDGLHAQFDKKFKSLVKIIKYWNKVYNNNRLRSYHLEVIIWRVFVNYQFSIGRYLPALAYFFQNANEHLASPCPDPTKLGDPIDSYLEPSARNVSMMKIAETLRLIASSMHAVGGAQITTLQPVFGNNFGTL